MHIAVTDPDPDVDATVDPCGLYAEHHWLPVLGPTAWLLGRRVNQLGNATIDGDELASSLGVARGSMHKAATRLVRFGLAEWWPEHDALTVPSRWPTVPRRLQRHVEHQVGINRKKRERREKAQAAKQEEFVAEAVAQDPEALKALVRLADLAQRQIAGAGLER